MACRGFIQCILKVLNLFLTMVGAAMVLYSLWMLHQWYKESSDSPTPASSMALKEVPALSSFVIEAVEGAKEIEVSSTLSFVMDQTHRLKSEITLPAPWFIYTFLGAGIVACVVSCVGHIAAETGSSCCLCFYTTLLGMLLILQGLITGAIFFDSKWREDIPEDPTGQVDQICSFIRENYDICKWVGLGVVVIQGLALLFSLILQAMADSGRRKYNRDDDYLLRTGDSTGFTRRQLRNDEWSKRMRQKYALDANDPFTYNP